MLNEISEFAQEVTINISNVSKATETSNIRVQEVNDSVEKLNHVAKNLQTFADSFVLDV